MNKQSDKFLIDQITQSNYAAFTELYDRYWRQLLRIALNKTGADEDAFDLVQDLFINLWQRRAQLTIEKSVESYLVSSLYYKVFMHFRKKGLEEKHLKHYTYFLQQNELLQVVPEEHNEMEYIKLINVVDETIELMPEKMKEVFNLKHKQSLSITEIAEILGISTQTVKNQLSNAMIKLRKAADQQMPGASASIFLLWLFS